MTQTDMNMAIFIGLAFGIVFLFFYILSREKTIEKKFSLIGGALENINQEIYKLQKHQKDNSLNIDSMVATKVEKILNDFIEQIKQTEYKNSKEIELLYEKILQLETNLKAIAIPNINPMMDKKSDKEKIKELFEIGYSIEEIAKEVGLPAGEVQLLLKF